ncbi:MAG: hypothetical protein RLZZ437_2805 [Pseudomonadota bacterium]
MPLTMPGINSCTGRYQIDGRGFVRHLAVLTLLATPALASDGIRTLGPLQDAAFLRLLTCGAPPEGSCAMAPVRWARPEELTIGFGPVPEGFPDTVADQIETAIDSALAAINGLGTAVQLRRATPQDRPHITLRPTLFAENDLVRDEAGIPDGARIGAGFVYVNWDESRHLTQATILIARDAKIPEIPSIVLEELVQSLGFLYDIENPDYAYVSIFAQDSNSVVTLTGQDATVLRLYYPNLASP